MYSRLALCAALLVPVGGLGLASKSSKSTKPIVVSDTAPVETWCLERSMFPIGSSLCLWSTTNCDTGQPGTAYMPCGVTGGGCPCDTPISAVRLPMDQVQGSAYVATSGPRFEGMRVAPNAFRGSGPEALQPTSDYEVVVDAPARIGNRAYRLFSVVVKASGKRYDLGLEMVGVNAATLATYPEGIERVVFGVDSWVSVSLLGEDRVFHVRSVGESLVPRPLVAPVTSELVPIPDHSLPKLNERVSTTH